MERDYYRVYTLMKVNWKRVTWLEPTLAECAE